MGSYISKDEAIMPADEIKVPGTHNALRNALAAIAVAKLMGVATADIVEVLQTFSGGQTSNAICDNAFNERKFYNDSKATNIEATEKALAGFQNTSCLVSWWARPWFYL